MDMQKTNSISSLFASRHAAFVMVCNLYSTCYITTIIRAWMRCTPVNAVWTLPDTQRSNSIAATWQSLRTAEMFCYRLTRITPHSTRLPVNRERHHEIMPHNFHVCMCLCASFWPIHAIAWRSFACLKSCELNSVLCFISVARCRADLKILTAPALIVR